MIQRVRALNLFLHDIYHDRKILKDGIVPRELVLGNADYCQEMIGFDVPLSTYVHVCGIDIVRDDDRPLPGAGGQCAHAVGRRLRGGEPPHDAARAVRPDGRAVGARRRRVRPAAAPARWPRSRPPAVSDPQVVLLSPGIYNSAYFEHVFLAREMGVPLVEGRDLIVEDDRVWMRTTAGLAPVHTIYRRLNDDFLDPDVFRPDSQLGVRGLIDAWRRGNVAIANAVGTGVADDKAIYAYMPRIIRYYLAEDADPAQCRDAYLRRAGGAGVHARASARAGGEAGGRIRRLRADHRPARQPRGAATSSVSS